MADHGYNMRSPIFHDSTQASGGVSKNGGESLKSMGTVSVGIYCQDRIRWSYRWRDCNWVFSLKQLCSLRFQHSPPYWRV